MKRWVLMVLAVLPVVMLPACLEHARECVLDWQEGSTVTIRVCDG